MNTNREFSQYNYYSPDHTKENNVDYTPINGNYISGFIVGDGCLALNLSDKNFCIMSLHINQHKNNKLLLESIAKYFNSSSKVYFDPSHTLQVVLTIFLNILYTGIRNIG
jgi:LAGLIDADG endonuclease